MMDDDRIDMKNIKYQGEIKVWYPLKTILTRKQRKKGLRNVDRSNDNSWVLAKDFLKLILKNSNVALLKYI